MLKVVFIQYISYESYLGRVCDLADKNRDFILSVLDDKDEGAINNNVLLLSKGCREECDLHPCGSSTFCSFFCHLGKMGLRVSREQIKRTNGPPPMMYV